MGHWWSHNSLTETGNGMRGQKLKAAWAKAESQATWKQECENKLISSRGKKPLQKPELQSSGSYLTPEENVSWPQTLESRAALSPLRRRNCLEAQELEREKEL